MSEDTGPSVSRQERTGEDPTEPSAAWSGVIMAKPELPPAELVIERCEMGWVCVAHRPDLTRHDGGCQRWAFSSAADLLCFLQAMYG